MDTSLGLPQLVAKYDSETVCRKAARTDLWESRAPAPSGARDHPDDRSRLRKHAALHGAITEDELTGHQHRWDVIEMSAIM